MVEIKGKISDFKELCHLVSLEGKDGKGKSIRPIPEFVINAELGKVYIAARNQGGQLVVSLTYKSLTTINPGQLVVGDVEAFLGYLDRFNSSDEVTLSTYENKLMITRSSPKKVARFPHSDVTSVETRDADVAVSKFVKKETGFFETPKTKFGIKLELSAEDVKDVIDDGEAVGQRIYPWNLSTSGLSVKVASETAEIETDIPIKKISKADEEPVNIQSAYAFGLDNVFNNLSGQVDISLANNIGACPMIIEQETTKYYIRIMVAPVVVSE